jgi:hypothetical protein
MRKDSLPEEENTLPMQENKPSEQENILPELV